ncbi:MAG TPA: RnfH family protein [Burkholderiales bacterium]|nr:RnfH family protein [Burkholderiales bacterium]
MSHEIAVEVVYARLDQQMIIEVRVPVGAKVSEAIEQSGIARFFPEIDIAKSKVGIFGKLTKLDALLRDRDRVEIYRPLSADPKDVRRKRAEAGKGSKKSPSI